MIPQTPYPHLHLSESFGGENQPSLEDAAYLVYQQLFDWLKDEQLHPLRIWNRVPDINRGADASGSGSEERYKLFNKGRRRAWLEYDPSLKTICAATCVGKTGEDVIDVWCLATSHRVIHLENPQQISFLDYSAKYGTPPSSRRGTLHLTPNGYEIWISGTASITGEDNRFAGDHEAKDVQKQTVQTLENIQLLISDENLKYHYADWNPHKLHLAQLEQVRVYYRSSKDLEAIQQTLVSSGLAEAEYVQADICRKPLDVEIEGMMKVA